MRYVGTLRGRNWNAGWHGPQTSSRLSTEQALKRDFDPSHPSAITHLACLPLTLVRRELRCRQPRPAEGTFEPFQRPGQDSHPPSPLDPRAWMFPGPPTRYHAHSDRGRCTSIVLAGISAPRACSRTGDWRRVPNLARAWRAAGRARVREDGGRQEKEIGRLGNGRIEVVMMLSVCAE